MVLERFSRARAVVRYNFVVSASLDRTATPRKVESVNHIEVLDALDVSARVEQMSLLRDGWHDGEGRAPMRDGLRWFATAWQSHWPSESPLPRLFPTLEGGVQAEWTIGQVSISAEVDLVTRLAALLVVKTQSGDIVTDETVNLASGEGWKTISRCLQSVNAR